MLQPKRTKYRKHFRIPARGLSNKGNTVATGEWGLQSTQHNWINGKQIEAARKVIVREMKRKGKLWIRIFPHTPFTKKPAEVRMGGGKGDVEGYVAIIQPGRIMFELSGVPENVAREALRKAAQKLPVLTKIVSKHS